MEYNVISADNHIMEPRNLFAERLPEKFRDQAPRVMRGKDGGDGWSFDGKTVLRTFGLEATAGRSVQVSGYTWEEILPGNFDGSAHIEDMTQEGVDAAVLFPTVPLAGWSMGDSEYGLALIQTFNDWLLDEFCTPDPNRLIGLAMLPVNHSMEVCLAEFARCLKKGAKAFHIPAFPDTPYIDHYYDPIWARAAEAGTPVCFHRTSGGTDPAPRNNFQFDIPGVNVAGTVIRFFSGVEPLTLMIYTGLFKRHPKLKIVDAEVNFGWIPFWKDMMDDQFVRQKGWAQFPIDDLPSETLGKNVFVTVLDDKTGFDLVASNPMMADVALFSIDYPHSVCLWPDTAGYIKKATANVDPVAKQKILAGNSVEVFNLN
jgi:predicted TIM-barrel fold metal-dependent hydrolase